MSFIPSRTRSTPTAFLLESLNPEAIIITKNYSSKQIPFQIHLLNATKEFNNLSAEKKKKNDVYSLIRKQKK
jgi:hypothetical protein